MKVECIDCGKLVNEKNIVLSTTSNYVCNTEFDFRCMACFKKMKESE